MPKPNLDRPKRPGRPVVAPVAVDATRERAPAPSPGPAGVLSGELHERLGNTFILEAVHGVDHEGLGTLVVADLSMAVVGMDLGPESGLSDANSALSRVHRRGAAVVDVVA